MEKNEALELIRNSEIIILSPTKANLKKVLKWTSSRYNEFLKKEVVDSILKNLQKESIYEIYTAATYTETNGYGVKYILLKEGREAYLIENGNISNIVYKLI